MQNKLVILDRDGVINQDSDNYIKSPEEWIPLPGSLQAIARLNNAGYKVAVATNQSGIARGLYDLATLEAMHEKFRRLLNAEGGQVDMMTFCPHGPGDICDCRKPKPGMYQQIAKQFNTGLSNVPVIGDSARDLEAAISVGALPILVRTGKGERTLAKEPAYADGLCFADLAEAVDYLLHKDA
jgi:D-glycero-D-manno-heptose 1,7-bisphosphate phosphatase